MTFSIIIPCYNGSKTIKRALSSVEDQTYNEFEIIIVDDGSSDNSKEVIEEFFKDKELDHKYIYQENGGAASARNKAVANSRGKYLAFLDSDDEWHRDKLKLQLEYIEKLKTNFITTNYTYEEFGSTGEIKIEEYDFDQFLISNRTSTPCVIVSRELFDRVGGFNETQRYSEDYYLWLNIVHKEKMYKIVNPLVRLHKQAYGESGLSADLWEMEKGELSNYKYLYKKNYIPFYKYCFLNLFSMMKYLRRAFNRYITKISV